MVKHHHVPSNYFPQIRLRRDWNKKFDEKPGSFGTAVHFQPALHVTVAQIPALNFSVNLFVVFHHCLLPGHMHVALGNFNGFQTNIVVVSYFLTLTLRLIAQCHSQPASLIASLIQVHQSVLRLIPSSHLLHSQE